MPLQTTIKKSKPRPAELAESFKKSLAEIEQQIDADPVINVRRQWNDGREAQYRLSQISDLHLRDESGGVRARANRFYLHGRVWCDQMVSGEVAHSCNHGPGPHHILVCIVKCANRKALPQVLARHGQDQARRQRRAV